jgi:intein/homing endonuclease
MEDEKNIEDISDFIPYYPSIEDPNFSYEIARKKEFYDLKLPPVEEVPTVQGTPLLSQKLQSMFFSPNTNFTSGLLFHGMGTGKCVLPGTKVFTSLGNIEIEKLWKSKYSKFVLREDDGGEWFKLITKIFVPSFNGTCFDPRSIKNLYRQHIIEIILFITLENGYSIKLTKAHKLFNGKEWTNTFSVNDKIGIPDCNYDTFRVLFEKGSESDDWFGINLSYSKIISIKKEFYKGYVYDLEIDEVHNYVANGFLCHNTCTSALIVENFKNSLVGNKARKPALIIVPNAKIMRIYKDEVINRCTKEGVYVPQQTRAEELEELRLGTSIKLTEMTQERRLKSAIEKSYKIVTLETFLFKKVTIKNDEGYAMGVKDDRRIPLDPNIIRKNYSDRVIIIDEAHKIREKLFKKRDNSDDDIKSKQYGELHRFLHAVRGCRIILLTGTPIWDQVHEISSLMNLILPENEQLSTGRAFIREFFDSKKNLNPKNVEILRSRFRGKVSFLRQMVTTASKDEIGIGKPWLKYITVYPSAMSDFQYKYAKNARDEVKTTTITYKTKTGKSVTAYRVVKGGVFSTTARDAASFVFPVIPEDYSNSPITEGSYGNSSYNKNIEKYYQGKAYRYKNPHVEKAIKNDLAKYSSKFAAIIKEIKDHPDELIFIYDEFIIGGGGAINLALVLQTQGFLWARGVSEIRKPDPRGRKRFTVITSDVATIKDDKQVSKFIESFNKSDNKYGERCQIIIGSETIGTGVTIKNVRQVHIVTPHWTIPEIDQALGRVIRVGSHTNLPEKDRTIRIYRHVSVKRYEKHEDNIEYNKGYGFPINVGFSDEETMDIHSYSIAEEKEYLNTQIYRLLKEVSWDCPLTYKRNVLENDKDYSRDCDYVKCNYKCDGFPEKYINKEEKVWNYNIPLDNIDKNTFYIYQNKQEVTTMKTNIYKLFSRYFNLNLSVIESFLNITTRIQKNILLQSLDSLIEKKDAIINRYGFINFLKEDGNMYFLDSNISVFSNYDVHIYIKHPFVVEYTPMNEIIEIFQLQQDKKFVDLFCHNPKEQSDLLDNMHYKTLIVLLEKVQELRTLPKNKLTFREKEVIVVIIKKLGHYLITLDTGVVIHNMGTSEYTGLGYNVTVKELKPTGFLRIFDNTTKKWFSTSIKEEEIILSNLRKIKIVKNTNKWDDNPYGVYGFIDNTNKFKIRVKAEPGKRETKGSVCSEVSWNIPRLYQLFNNIGEFPPASSSFDVYSRDELIKDIKSQPSLTVFHNNIENRSDRELREILTIHIMDKKQMCKTLEIWLKSKNLFFDYR